ncbi:MAG: hypothetical protein OSB09_02790 [Planctomycetota bacterium]|nr:hypothetical protein [Planctomycetota bacterium]
MNRFQSSTEMKVGTRSDPPQRGRPLPLVNRQRFSMGGTFLLLLLVGLSACVPTKQSAQSVGESSTAALQRGTAHVDVSETIDGDPTELNITRLILERGLSLHGFQLVPRAEAQFVVEGTLTCEFFQDLNFEFKESKQHLEYQFHGKFDGRLTSIEDGRIQELSFPEPLMNGRTDMGMARRDIRRRSATIISETMLRGPILGDPEIRGLLDALTDPLDGRFHNQVLEEIVAHQERAVPYLIEALRDDRAVRLEGEYAGFSDLAEGELKVYHIVDKALTVLLDRASGLDPLSSDDFIQRVRTGWQWAWEDIQQVPDELRILSSQRKAQS